MHISKMRRSAFADTRLGLLLRTNDIRHVTLAACKHFAVNPLDMRGEDRERGGEFAA